VLAAFIVRVVGDGKKPGKAEQVAPALNPALHEMPPLAIAALRRELRMMGDRVREQLDLVIQATLAGKTIDTGLVQEREQLIDRHHAEIIHFAGQLLQVESAVDIRMAAVNLVEAADYLESLADLIEKELLPLYERQRASGISLSPGSGERLRAFAVAVSAALDRSLKAVEDADEALAGEILDAKPELRRLERAVLDLEAFPNDGDSRPRIARAPLERELAESLRRTYSLVRRFVRVGTGLLRTEMDRETTVLPPGP
jgi:Na+/phosphate symporter